ncbi:MAG TPA: exodeoxyribonuclease III [Gemmatimonadales bacterium]|nr:exodeoxyribonuclease III [Gemmatimonadales bacterium]
MKVATWNVNGIRARASEVREWLERERPDVVCLQELKAEATQIPEACNLVEYHAYWHGRKGYSGVSLLIRRDFVAADPVFGHPPFDVESRIVQAEIDDRVIASVYVPNGGKDYAAKLQFLTRLTDWVREVRAEGRELLVCGDINVARTDLDVHPKERKLNAIGQRPDERALLETLLDSGLTDLGRAFDPDDPGLFTWWAPWRNLRARNIGWRIDYVLASPTLAASATGCVVEADVGTSDHAPVLLTTTP